MKLKTKSQAKPSKDLSPFMREVLAIFFLAVGVFFYLCLLSYDPMDPSFATLARGREIQNWGGIVGSYLADLLFLLLGGGAWFAGFFFFLIAVLLFAGYRTRIRAHEAVVYFIFVVFISVLFQLRAGSIRFGTNVLDAGGLIGGLLARAGLASLGRPGTYLVVLFGSLVTFVWATRVSLKQLFYWGRALIVPVGRFAAQQAVIYYARARKFLSAWREERKKKKIPPAVAPVKINRYSTPFTRPGLTPLGRTAHPAGLGSLPGPTARPPVPIPAGITASSSDTTSPGSTPLGPAPLGLAPLGQTTACLLPEPVTGEPRILDRVDKKRPRSVSPQLELQHLSDGYHLPPLSLLDSDSKQEAVVDEESLKMQARLLEKKLLDFDVEGHVTEIHPGPVITMFEFAPAPGVKLSRIANLVDDLSLAMGGRPVRIVAPLPNKPAVGIEIPNNVRETVWLKDVIVDEKFHRSESKLVFALGKDIEGIPYVTDLAKMPHLLVAGATGAGKSVSINSMIISLLYKATPEEVRVIMVDPKMLELSLYEGIPHLLLPVVTEPKKASLALRWAVREMERRYKLLADINARNIVNYNKKIEKGDYQSKRALQLTSSPETVAAALADGDEIRHEGKLPYIVILIDELADLMMVSSREVEESITRLAQMARAAGIHLILATQRPSVDVLTGVIKANFPARISFKVSSKHDSRTILDTIGSEHLLGAGDMLFIPPGASQMIRVHGAYVTELEIGRVVDFLKKQAKPIYDESILKPIEVEPDDEGGEEGVDSDALYDQAVAIVAETRQASISMIQRKLRVGYNRAARMIEKMEIDGIVSPPSGAGHRQVLVSSFEAPQ